jgi:hypothetical protein
MPAVPAFVLTGTFSSLTSTDTGYVTIELQNFRPFIPRSGGYVIEPTNVSTAPPAATFSVTVYGNDVITPGNTFYLITVFDANGRPVSSGKYFLAGTSGDLSTLLPAGVTPAPTPSPALVGAGEVLIGPVTGTGAPTFRNLQITDLPTTGNYDFNGTFTGNTGFSGSLTFPGDATIIMGGASDPYAGLISAAITALPSSGGVIDARSSNVASIPQGSVDPGSKSVTILLGPWTYTFTQVKVRSGLRIYGSDEQRTLVQASLTASGSLFTGPAPTEVAAFSVAFQDFSVIGPGGNTQTPATPNYLDAFHFDASNVLSANYPNANLLNCVWNRISVNGFGGSAWKFLGAQTAGNAGAHQFLSFYDCAGIANIGPGSGAISGFTLTSVAVTGVTTTYNGTITGGAANAYAGFQFTVAGFVNAGNNVTFTVTSSTATTLVTTTTTQVNETHAATSTGIGMSPVLMIVGSNFQHFWWNSQINGYLENAATDSTNGSIPLVYIGNSGSIGSEGNPFIIGFKGLTVQGRQNAVQLDGCTDVTFNKIHMERNFVCFDVSYAAGVPGIVPSGGTNSFNSGLTVDASSFDTDTAVNSGSGAIIAVNTTKLYGMTLQNSVYNSPLFGQTGAGSPDHWLLLNSTPAVPVSLLNNIDVNAASDASFSSAVMLYPNAPTTAIRGGTANGTNYTTTSTSLTPVDATNLKYVIGIPLGWKLLVQVSGSSQSDTAATTDQIAIVDGVTTVASTIVNYTAGAGGAFSLSALITGNEAPHTIELQFATGNAGDKLEIVNQPTGWVNMTFLLTPSN